MKVYTGDKRREEIKLDEIDQKILALLSENANSSVKDIANQVKIPLSTAFSRIKRLEEKGVIKGYTIKVNPSVLGFTITAVIHFSVEGPYLEEIEQTLANHPNIVALYDITGEFDIVAIARFRDIDELDHFIKSVLKNPKVRKTITSVVLRVVKENYPGIPMITQR